MLRWAIKSMIVDRGALIGAAAGVGVALLLVLLLEGVFAGASDTIVAYPQAANADVWVMQKGVANMHMASSLIDGDLVGQTADVPGVESVEPILYVNSFIETEGGALWFAYIVGITLAATNSGPWEMAAGAPVPRAGEAVLPEGLAKKAGVRVGDEVRVLGRELRVSGLSRGTFSMANSIAFVAYADLESMREASGAASYVLVRARPGVDAEALAEAIRTAVPGVNAVTSTVFIENDREVALQMGVNVVRLMSGVGGGVALLIIAFTLFTHAARRSRELAIAKALGATSRSLYGALLVQSLFIASAGFAASVVLALIVEPIIETAVPEVAVTYVPTTAGWLLLVSLVVGIVASVVIAQRVARTDPAAAFSGS